MVENMNSETLGLPITSQTIKRVGTLSGTSNAQVADVKNPGLANIFADPSMIQTLTADAVANARGKLARLDSLLLAPLMNANSRRAEGAQLDRRLSVEDAAAKLGTSKDWLYRHADTLPFTVRIGRRLGFSEVGIDCYLRQRAGR
jgi:predicted DNA-binding transcriptional regulator AlpA